MTSTTNSESQFKVKSFLFHQNKQYHCEDFHLMGNLNLKMFNDQHDFPFSYRETTYATQSQQYQSLLALCRLILTPNS